MNAMKALLIPVAGAAALLALGAAQHPMALAQSSGGLWEISGVPGAKVPPRMCIADPAVLAQFEHRRQMCTRVVISDTPPSTLIHYTCAGGGFGRTKMTMITPRAIRIETQGISDNLPFNYVLQARRVGECPARQTARTH